MRGMEAESIPEEEDATHRYDYGYRWGFAWHGFRQTSKYHGGFLGYPNSSTVYHFLTDHRIIPLKWVPPPRFRKPPCNAHFSPGAFAEVPGATSTGPGQSEASAGELPRRWLKPHGLVAPIVLKTWHRFVCINYPQDFDQLEAIPTTSVFEH